MDSGCDAAVLRRQLADPLLAVTHPAYRPLLWTLPSCVLLFIGWTAWTQLDEMTCGDGRVVPFSHTQEIQSLEGGILGRLLVRKGDLMKVDQPLMRLDETRFLTNLQESANQTSVLRTATARFDAEVLGEKSIKPPPGINPEEPLTRSRRELFKLRRDKSVEGTRAIQRQTHLAQNQSDSVRPLVAKRAVSQVETLKLSQGIAVFSGKLTKLKSTCFQNAYTEHTQYKADLSVLEPAVQQRQDQLCRTKILSPVRRRTNTVLINTCGGVIQPGESIMEVISVEERLSVEMKIKPRDVAFLVPGMSAKAKITAYDYTTYGDLKGTLEQTSADTIEEDTPHSKESRYQALIKTDGGQLKHSEEVLPIIPRTVAEMDILSGKRSVLSYLPRPLVKTRLY